MENFEGESKEEEIKKEKEYIININNIVYQLSIIKDYKSIELKIISKNNLEMFYYYNKYSISKIIDIFKLNSCQDDNSGKIMEIINDAYSNKKISAYLDNNDNNKNIKLIFKLSNKEQKNYSSTLILTKNEYKIGQKLEILINEISSLKQSQNDFLKNKFNEIEKVIINIKTFLDKKIIENNALINSLNIKIKDNEKLLKENKNNIQSLQIEIKILREIMFEYESNFKNNIYNSKGIKEKNNNIDIKKEKKE